MNAVYKECTAQKQTIFDSKLSKFEFHKLLEHKIKETKCSNYKKIEEIKKLFYEKKFKLKYY
jgi:hypothetical protein